MMSQPSTFNLDALVAPIPGDDPAGKPTAYAEMQQLLTSRNNRDWKEVRDRAIRILTSESKNLEVAGELVIALTGEHGFSGLRAGLALLGRLYSECWDRLYPRLEDDQVEEESLESLRSGVMRVLNDGSVGFRRVGVKLPLLLQELPLLAVRGAGQRDITDRFSYIDTISPERKQVFEDAIPQVDIDQTRAVLAELAQCQTELTNLSTILDERLTVDYSPNLQPSTERLNLGGAMENCRKLAESVLKQRGEPLQAPLTPSVESIEAVASTADPEDSPPSSGVSPMQVFTPGATRAELFAQIEQIAQAFEQLEQQSVVPVLLRRAIRLGKMPLAELMKELLNDDKLREEIERKQQEEADD